MALYVLSLISVAAYTADLDSDLKISSSDTLKAEEIAFSRIGIILGEGY